MADYSLDKYEFKKYLLDELSDTRQEELIFWKRNIPMPVDLIYDIFEKRGNLFSAYLDHIGAAFLFAWTEKKEGRSWVEKFASQPTKENIGNKALLHARFSKYFEESGVGEMLNGFAELFLLENYQPDPTSLVMALCHDGRKYKRLYIPFQVREKLKQEFPEILDEMSLSNWDMFSNVIADELKVYRMGFADAFNGIFIKLTEFVLKSSEARGKKLVSAIGFDLLQKKVNSLPHTGITYGSVSDGSAWEPLYNGGRTTAVLNKMHPFSDQLRKCGSETEAIVIKLLNIMAEKENLVIRDRDKKVIELFRQDVSRELRIKIEEEF
ncbi:hypothetical protein [Pedobacter sp.]